MNDLMTMNNFGKQELPFEIKILNMAGISFFVYYF